MPTQMTSVPDQLPSISTVGEHFLPSFGNACRLVKEGRRDERGRRAKVEQIRHRQNAKAKDGTDGQPKNWENPNNNQKQQQQQNLTMRTANCCCCCCCLWRRGRGRTRRKRATTKTAPMAGQKMSSLSPIFKNGFSTTIFAILIVVLQRVDSVGAVRCYCTDEHCVPYGVCEAAVCLVGLLRANNAVIRTCGNEALGCQRNLDRWAHICSCEEHFCNTFLFLRASTNIDNAGTGTAAATARGRSGGGRTAVEQYQHQQQMGPPRDEDDRRVFERIDPPPGEFATFDHPTDGEERTIKNSNMLTLLLVIVPLSVGAAAVVVVAINYYCHLC
ncbi:hypothetical protein niasHS_014111 [Heterodera schachtii]|uniref:Uncharacterized protein n=1 Tax=Heterodera schachtii TaxID=97005 RepID=A0ABD2II48_HETSC